MGITLDKIVFKRIYAVNTVNHKQRFTSTQKDRTLYALAYKTTGKTVYTCGGKSYVSDREHLLFIPKNLIYTVDCIGLGTCFMIEFDSDCPLGEFASFPVADCAGTERLFRNMSGIWTMKGAGFELACLSCAYEILYKVHIGTLSARYAGKKSVIRPALDYIESHLSDPEINNDRLASVSSVSTVYFRKLFVSVFGMPPMQYLRMLRIEKAKDLLLGDYSSVTDIAEATGFSSVYSFCRTFKSCTGLTPTEYAGRSRKR